MRLGLKYTATCAILSPIVAVTLCLFCAATILHMDNSPKDKKALRILIVRLTAIGDVIHVLPSFAALRRALPDAHIGWVVEDRAADLLRGLPGLDTLHVVPRRAWKKEGRSLWGKAKDILMLRREMRDQAYDYAIDFQGLTKSGIWGWLSGAAKRIGYGDEDGREFNKWFTNQKIIPNGNATHVIDRNAALLKPLGIESINQDFPMAWDADDETTADSCLSDTAGKGPVAVLNPGAGWETKRWSPEQFGALGQALIQEDGYRVIVVWAGDAEKTMAETIVKLSGDGATLARPTSLRELAALLSKTQLFVGSDTGPMHIAVGLGVPTVALYGAADPKRNGPYGEQTRVVNANVECSPCWKVRGCPYDLKCMKEISPEMVLAAARELRAGAIQA